MASLLFSGYIAFLRFIETQSIDLEKLIHAIQSRGLDEIRSIVMSSAYGTVFERALASRSLREFENEILQIVAKHLEEMKLYAPHEARDIVASIEAIADLENLIGVLTARDPRAVTLVPLGPFYRCVHGQPEFTAETIAKCIEHSVLGLFSKPEEIASLIGRKEDALRWLVKAKLYVWKTVINSIDRSSKYCDNAPRAIRELAALDIALLYAMSEELALSEQLRAAMLDVFGCDPGQQSIAFCLGVYRRSIAEALDELANIVRENPERASLTMISIAAREIMPFLRSPGDNLDLLLYLLVTKLFEIRVLRYAFIAYLEGVKQ